MQKLGLYTCMTSVYCSSRRVATYLFDENVAIHTYDNCETLHNQSRELTHIHWKDKRPYLGLSEMCVGVYVFYLFASKGRS